MTTTDSPRSTKGKSKQRESNPASQATPIDSRLLGIVRALARHTAREYYAQPCLAVRKDSDSGVGTVSASSAVIDFHPQVADLYRQRIGELQAALEADAEACQKAIAALRELIDRIGVVFGKGRGEFAVTIKGRLATILALAHGQDPESLVAGAGFEPATFRL